jgi:ATP-binding cassette subfamily B protein
MVAHRLSSIARCDRIFVLDKGRCVASGPYDELLRTSTTFRDLANASLLVGGDGLLKDPIDNLSKAPS